MGKDQFAKGGQGGFLALLVALGKTYPFGCGSAALWFKKTGFLMG